MQADYQLQTSFTLPTGATSGTRIFFDGINGQITAYYADNTIAYQLSTSPTASIADFADILTTTAAFFGGQLIVKAAPPISSVNNSLSLDWNISVPGGDFILTDNAGVTHHLAMKAGATNCIALVTNNGVKQTPTLNAGYTNNTCMYWIDNEDNLEWTGELVQTTGVVGAGRAIVFTLAPPYVPVNKSVTPVTWRDTTGVTCKGAGYILINTTGDVYIAWPATTANGDMFSVASALAPLGNA